MRGIDETKAKTYFLEKKTDQLHSMDLYIRFIYLSILYMNLLKCFLKTKLFFMYIATDLYEIIAQKHITGHFYIQSIDANCRYEFKLKFKRKLQ